MKIPFIILFFGLILNSSNQTHPASFSYDDEKFYKGQTKTLDLKQLSCRVYDNSNIIVIDSLLFLFKETSRIENRDCSLFNL